MSPPSCHAVEQPLPSGSRLPQLTLLRSATPAPDDEDYTGLELDATSSTEASNARTASQTGSPHVPADVDSSAEVEMNSNQALNVDVTEPDQAGPAPSGYLSDPVGFSIGPNDAPADDASSADAGGDSD
uniref:Uncharacterized protein n=1 Tax=Peronospora matthiolae TaxID=2874970 RepID=A0AAV1TTB4_9STRA